MLLYLADQAAAALRLAAAADLPAHEIRRHRFPDDETRLQLPPALPPHVVLYRSLDRPNEKLVELLLAARTARTLGAQRLTLVAPYLAYMRQDMAFLPGEAVSQRIVGAFLGELFDAVITVDPHLHRIDTLGEAVQGAQAVTLTAAPALAACLRGDDALIVGPDAESAQWVEAAAAAVDLPFAVCRKQRHGDRDVAVALDGAPVAGRRVVLLDDVASSGRTLATAARVVLAAGAASVDVAVTHALFVDDALAELQRAGVRRVVSSDAVAHSTNAVWLAGALAQALRVLG